MEIHTLSAHGLRKAVRSRDVTAEEVARAHLGRITAHDKEIRAFLHIDAEGALSQARDVDDRIGRGEPAGPLAGVPVALKDNLCLKDTPTTCASRILEGFRPPYDAHVVERIRKADGIILGKTNLDEFAMGSSTENSGIAPTRNPWDTDRAPGGSSGGSAAAVAAGFAPLALGSDTGGSIRQPASFCGVVGVKPTYGMVSRYGLIAFGSSLDQIGPFARSVEDAALLMDVIAGHDNRDATSARGPAPRFADALESTEVKGLRVGVPEEYFGTGLSAGVEEVVRAAVAALEGLGATVKPVHLPHTKYAVPIYYIVATAEASSNLGRYDGVHYGHRTDRDGDIIELFSRSREEGFGPEVKRRIMLGTYALSAGYYDAYYLRALKVRTLVAQDFDAAFGEVDVLAAPTSPTPAFKLGEKADDPLSMYLSDIYTISANLAGIPALSVPCGEVEGLSVGAQLMASRFDDARLLGVAHALESALGTAGRVAPLG